MISIYTGQLYLNQSKVKYIDTIVNLGWRAKTKMCKSTYFDSKSRMFNIKRAEYLYRILFPIRLNKTALRFILYKWFPSTTVMKVTGTFFMLKYINCVKNEP